VVCVGRSVPVALLDAWLSSRIGPRGRAALAAAVGAAALVAGLNCAPDPELFHHLALARAILERGLPLAEDPILALPARPGPFPYWLSSLALGAAERLGGRGTVLVLAAACVAVAVVATWLAGSRRGEATWYDATLGAPAVLLLLLAIRGGTGPHPEILAAVLLGATLLATQRFLEAEDARVLLLLPVAAAAWANLDPSLPLGVAVPAAPALEAAWRAWRGAGARAARRAALLGGVAAAGVVASAVSPWPGSTLVGDGDLVAAALAALRASSPSVAALALCLAAAPAALLSARGGRLAEGALALGGALVVAGSPRAAPLGALLIAPALLGAARALLPPAGARARVLLGGAALALTAGGALAWSDPPGVTFGLSAGAEEEPEIARLLLPWPAGVIYTTPALGAWVAWRLGVKVASDVRPSGSARLGGPLPPAMLRQFDALLLPFRPDLRASSPPRCGDEVPVDPSVFALVGYDDVAMLWVRRDGSYRALAEKELRVLRPCEAPSARELADAAWTDAFLAEARTLAGLAPNCTVCAATVSVARLARGESASPPDDGPHPALAPLRVALHRIADARAADAERRAAAGDLTAANAGYWASLHAADAPRARAGLALQLAALGENAGAVEHARRGVALDPSSADALFALGVALHASGDRAEGDRALRASLGAQPFGQHAIEALRLLRGGLRQAPVSAPPGSRP
jgi:hypothetical protein